MKLKVVFFCGHKSPYGLAHLSPILDRFDVKAVVVGSDERWELFRQQLIGKTYYSPDDNLYNTAIKTAKKLLPSWITRIIKGNYRKSKPVLVEEILLPKHINFEKIFDVNSNESLRKFIELDADLFMVAAYPQIFSKSLLEIPKRGSINFHPSLLPKYRGAHPHYWQIVNGEKDGGITAHFMTENIDDGDIVSQLKFPIEDVGYDVLYEKIIMFTPCLVNEVRLFFEENKSKAIPQDHSLSTYYKNERDIHNRIFWNSHSSIEIHHLTRTGRSFCFFRGKKVTILSSYITTSNRNLVNGVRVENGTIIDICKDSLVIKTLDGCLHIKEIREDNRNLTYLQWAKKKNLFVGDKLS
jgi:methionyl-tRNA formyltransferase